VRKIKNAIIAERGFNPIIARATRQRVIAGTIAIDFNNAVISAAA